MKIIKNNYKEKMKVIKNNYKEPTPEYPKTIECPACSSIFLLEDKNEINIQKEFSYPYNEIIGQYEYIKCPCCQKEIKISSLMPWECDNCDGCGWYEGGVTLKTTCENCGGTGIIHKLKKF